MQTKIEFLGQIICEGKLYPSKEKTRADCNFQTPKNVKEVQRFLGLSGYFRKFIANYSRIARPLTDMMRKNAKFAFPGKERAAFNEFKYSLASQPVLPLFRQGAETELHCDASSEGFGAVLLQRCEEEMLLHPVYYSSKKTSDAEKKYSSYDLETLPVINGLKKFRVYLLGTKSKIARDCAAFQKTVFKKDIPSRIARWALMLEQ